MFVSAGCGADGFVASGEGYDGEEGEEEADGGLDVPPSEDEAEVCGVPCEQHLPVFVSFNSRRTEVGLSEARLTFMLHIGIPPISPCPIPE